jgi:predicted nucleotidyltransferase
VTIGEQVGERLGRDGLLVEAERECLRRYVGLVEERLGATLEEVWLFGSAARGDMWPDRFPIHSDIDVLLVTAARIGEEVEQELVDATYPLFLECGRQIGPHFYTAQELAEAGRAEFAANVRRDGVRLGRRSSVSG